MSSTSKRSPRKSAPPRQSGNATAFIFGMVFGLAIALGLAWYLNRAELPFSGVSTQGATPDLAPGPNQAPPDPNTSVYGSASSSGGGITTVEPFKNDQAEPVARTVYYLQLGSFRNREDAEQLRARLAFIGTESEIAVGQVNDTVVNRVRVGPFTSANEAYQARIPLTKGGFEATVVKE